MGKADLIGLVEKIISGDGTEDDGDTWVSLVEQQVPDPNVWNRLCFLETSGLGDALGAEDMSARLPTHPMLGHQPPMIREGAIRAIVRAVRPR